MTRDDILHMAEECGIPEFDNNESQAENILRFAALVAAAERNRTWTQAHWTEYEHSIAAAEREACANVCDNLAKDRGMFHPDDEDFKNGVLAGAGMCAVTIRARRKK